MKRLLKTAAALAVSAALAGPLAAQDFAITNATVATGDAPGATLPRRAAGPWTLSRRTSS